MSGQAVPKYLREVLDIVEQQESDIGATSEPNQATRIVYSTGDPEQKSYFELEASHYLDLTSLKGLVWSSTLFDANTVTDWEAKWGQHILLPSHASVQREEVINRTADAVEKIAGDPESDIPPVALVRAMRLVGLMGDVPVPFVAPFGDQLLLQWRDEDTTIDVYINEDPDSPSFAMVSGTDDVHEVLTPSWAALRRLIRALGR